MTLRVAALVAAVAAALLVACQAPEGEVTPRPTNTPRGAANSPGVTATSPSPAATRATGAGGPTGTPSPSPSRAMSHEMWVAVEDAGTLVRVDLDAAQVVESLDTGDGPHNITVAADGTVAAALYGGSAVALVRDGELRRIELGASPHDVKPTPDGFAVANESGRRVELLARDGQLRARIELRAEPHDLDITPDGSRAWVTLNGTDELALVDLAEAQVVRYVATGEQPHDIRIAEDGAIWVTDWRGRLHTFSSDGELLHTLSLGREAHHLAFTPDGAELWVVDHATRRVYVVDAGSREVVAEVALAGAPHHVAITQDGQMAGIADHTNGALVVVNVASRRQVASIPVGAGPHGVWEVPPAG